LMLFVFFQNLGFDCHWISSNLSNSVKAFLSNLLRVTILGAGLT
jgi:hypothetical protein